MSSRGLHGRISQWSPSFRSPAGVRRAVSVRPGCNRPRCRTARSAPHLTASAATGPKAMELSAEQFQRYARHLILDEVGEEGQEKLLQSRVLVVGAGGVGSPRGVYMPP